MLSRWIAAKAQQHTPASAPPLPQHYLLLGAAGLFTLGVAVGPLLSYGGARRRGGDPPWIPAPSRVAAATDAGERGVSSSSPLLAYPPDALPGGRDVATPYGSVRVFEWGPEDGEPVMLLHGISTPAIALGDLAHDLAARGHRVLLFDLWGRGWSDAPVDVAYDARLYVSQMLLVLASSRADWSRFHLVGYSFGGALAVAFTRYFAHRVASLSLIATAGLLRPSHVGLVNRFLYNSGVLPEGLVRWIVRRRLRPATKPEAVAEEAETDLLMAESKHAQRHGKKGSSKKEKKESATKSSKSSTKLGGKDGLRGGSGSSSSKAGAGTKGDTSDPDSVFISRHRRDVTVAAVVAQQVDTHEGFVTAFLSSIRNSPIYAPQADWEALRDLLAERRRGAHRIPGLDGGRVLLVLGAEDPICVASEVVEDAQATLGATAVEPVILNAGHDLPITKSREIADTLAHHMSRAAGRGKKGLFG